VDGTLDMDQDIDSIAMDLTGSAPTGFVGALATLPQKISVQNFECDEVLPGQLYECQCTCARIFDPTALMVTVTT